MSYREFPFSNHVFSGIAKNIFHISENQQISIKFISLVNSLFIPFFHNDLFNTPRLKTYLAIFFSCFLERQCCWCPRQCFVKFVLSMKSKLEVYMLKVSSVLLLIRVCAVEIPTFSIWRFFKCFRSVIIIWT